MPGSLRLLRHAAEPPRAVGGAAVLPRHTRGPPQGSTAGTECQGDYSSGAARTAPAAARAPAARGWYRGASPLPAGGSVEGELECDGNNACAGASLGCAPQRSGGQTACTEGFNPRKYFIIGIEN